MRMLGASWGEMILETDVLEIEGLKTSMLENAFGRVEEIHRYKRIISSIRMILIVI